ncbi:Kinase A-anchor protein Neurobeachin and related BEACH and WD40 repeat proteins [Plasmopara halstedii]|uniref:Kinase A-anchor protein Neurobeachin and related BEACH and WD40 repeat proteins n=1 Tax=Plasmopara halstedii TaxID=4781 RepID=A0A0P1B8I6_PLAHL|nr:Kinase A-anchor protein Neurobeachin and related BEACH and WD40 repeat proteins [Plasmopara halstedii]CEG50257.1 Kinase A-anchor protein Neurobeachin and related BEACH and WD40 repeat proteins [Plasmopara halstedii]|eukprot:XP_024586626.1 Kinase A-anchor protein Neurobeachin and related BEACH and WD40 repeat proteins [Plasmopara halstedii]
MLRKLFSSGRAPDSTTSSACLSSASTKSKDHGDLKFVDMVTRLELFEAALKDTINKLSRHCQAICEMVNSSRELGSCLQYLYDRQEVPVADAHTLLEDISAFRTNAIAPLQTLLDGLAQIKLKCEYRNSAKSIMDRYEQKVVDMESKTHHVSSRLRRNRAKHQVAFARFQVLDSELITDAEVILDNNLQEIASPAIETLFIQHQALAAHWMQAGVINLQNHLKECRTLATEKKLEQQQKQAQVDAHDMQTNDAEADDRLSDNDMGRINNGAITSLENHIQNDKPSSPRCPTPTIMQFNRPDCTVPDNNLDQEQSIFPRRNLVSGTRTWKLQRQMKDSMASGLDLVDCIQLPEGCQLDEWIAVHVIDFFNEISLLFGTISEFCTHSSCPVMSAGPCYTYLWADGLQQVAPISLPAADYVERLLGQQCNQRAQSQLYTANQARRHDECLAQHIKANTMTWNSHSQPVRWTWQDKNQQPAQFPRHYRVPKLRLTFDPGADMELSETEDVVSVFLQELLGGKEYSEADATRLHIRRPSRLKMLFTKIIGILDESEQIRALEALISLVRSSCGNVEACSTAGLQREILGFLSERGLFAGPSLPLTVLKKLLRVFLYLAFHSVNIDDIQAMFAVFRSMRMVHEEPDDQAVSCYLSTLELIARDSFGPASFFDLNGELSGLLMPVLPAFPNNGYTFCAWIKFELLPEEVAPLFTFGGKTGVGIMCSFLRSSLMITSFDKRKNDGHVEVPDLVTPGRWHFLCITHTHRQFRGSKLDVYLNSELRQSVRLAYPNTALMAPVVKAYLAMRESNGTNALRILLGPTALFGQALPASIINNIRSVDEYDALVFQFNSYISSSATSSSGGVNGTPGSSGGSNASGISTDGLLLAYDARHCDRLKGLCYDSSGNNYHAAAASAGVRLRHAGTFKQAVAQLGGPLICLPLLVTSTTAAVTTVTAPATELVVNGDDTSDTSSTVLNTLVATNGALTTQFDEDSDFLRQMSDLIARPMGVRSIPKVVLLIAEIMRHSLVNKFIFRRSQGVRLMALLIRSLPPHYLTNDLLIAIERLRSAVITDRILADEIYKFLLFNFRIWVNAPVGIQETMFDKLEIMSRKDSKNLSPASTRHFLRCLSWIYWRVSSSTTLRRAREFKPEEINLLRRRVLSMIRIVLCESLPAKTAGSVMAFSGKGKEVKSQLSYESTRTLIFCMIGKPSNPMIPGMNIDGTPIQEITSTNSASDSATVSSSSKTKSLPESDLDGSGSIVENVPEADLPDLVQLLIELSVQSTAPSGMLELFGRLGGLRIWLPLLGFSNDVIRVVTLRLLRTYLYLRCECSEDPEMVNSPDKIQLSVGDAYLIMHSLKPEELPVSMGVYSEILLMMLGVQVTEKDIQTLDGKTAAYDALIDENVLTTAMIWHDNMMPAFLGLVRASSVTIRMIAIRHLKIIFASSTAASSINRHVLIFGSISSMGGTATESSTTEQVPIIEAILSLRGDPQRHYENIASPPTSLFGIKLNGCPGVPMSRLRDMVLNTQEPDEVRVNALYSIIVQDDVDFVRGLLALHGDGDRKKQGVSASCFNDMSSRMKLALVELMSVYQPSGCVDFITLMSYDVISSMICLEVKQNEMAWFLLQDPFTTLSRFISSTEELEVVVVSLLKTTLDKMNEMLSAEMNLRFNEGTPSRESILWRNAESLASLAAAVVLHYDPDTLGKVDPGNLKNSSGWDTESVTQVSVFWKCERAIWHEAELVDSILGIWQHFASHFHSDSDASFARRSSNSHRRNSNATRPIENGMNSPPSLASAARSNAGSTMLGFGFNRLPIGVTQGLGSAASPPATLPGKHNISARPHPGGPMRQILQLLLRCLYLVLISDDHETATRGESIDNDELSSVKLRLPANSVFFQRINKLEYFINAMGLGHEIAQFNSCFAPSRSGSNGMTTTSGLVTASESVKAAPGDETTLLLWLIPELSSLIDRVRRKSWSESAVKLASILASLVSVPLRSSDQLAELLDRNEFITNNQEVRRRDSFYHEQMAHARDIRALRRVGMFDEEANEKKRAKLELARISKFTRSPASLSCSSNEGEEHVWLERVKAKDIDDWMKLRVLAKWGVRHVWGAKDDAVVDAVGDGTIIGLWGDNEFWRVDIYTSSNWIRCRLLPDTDDTISYRFGSNLASSILSNEISTNIVDELAMPSVDSIVVDDAALSASGELTEQLFEEEEDDDEAHTVSSGGDGEDPEVAESEENDYIGLARRISDVGYLDDDGTPTSTNQNGKSDDATSRLMLHDRIHSSEIAGDVVDATLRLNAMGENVELLSTAPLAPLPPEGTDNADSNSLFRDRRAVSVDVASTVKSAKGRIGTMSTRFSTGIKRLASARPTTLLSTAGSETSGSHRSISSVSEESGDMQDPQDSGSPDKAGEERPAPTRNEQSKPNSPKEKSSSGPASRMMKKFPTKHDHWKSLGAPFRTKAYLVLPSGVLVRGDLRIGVATIVFEGERVVTLRGIADSFKSNEDGGVAARQRSAQRLHEAYVSQVKRRVWGVRVIRIIHRRRFLMEGQNGLEIYFVDGSSCFFGLENNGEADLVYATLKERKPPCLAKWGKRLLSAERMLSKSKWTEMWVRREISNFEYLMALNVSAGRSYNDPSQYPVFPWVLKDYDSSEIRLDDEQSYRDLRRPIGAQTPEAIQQARAVYEGWDPKTPIPAFHHAKTYSHMQSVLYFLIRLAPFTNAILGSEEQLIHHMAANEPTFNSVADAFRMCTSDDRNMFELTPEFFYLPELFSSARNKTLARHFAPGQDVSMTASLKRDVALPPWAASPYDFVRLHRLALESDYVSSNLHHWIDLIFGYKQNGAMAVDALNTYHIASYPERLDLSTSSDGVRAKLVQRGTVPIQLFRKPHPVRMTQDESLEARFPASHSMAMLSSRRQVRRYDLPSKHTAAVRSVHFSNALNHAVALTALTGSTPGLGSGTGMGAHSTGSNDHGVVVYTTDSDGVVLAKRYMNAVPDTVRSCPFSMVDVDQWWKLPPGCLVSEGVVFYEQMISCGYWDGSWRIHWAADGELLQRIAFHKKPILCMARSEDDFTGDMALAFGSEDCTVSVWALSKLSASRSRRLFLKKELPVGGLPWVLLVGHTSPVVAVALNVDLDVVVSASKDNMLLLHSLRGSTPLHALALTPGPMETSAVSHMVISAQGDTLVHSITTHKTQRSGRYSRANSIFSDDKAQLTVGETGSGNCSMVAGGLSSSGYVATMDQHEKRNDGSEQQSELYIVSINGHVVSHDKLFTKEEGESTEENDDKPKVPQLLLERGVLFTRSGEYLITACAGADAAIEVRDAGMPGSVVRRIECKRTNAELTSLSMGQDERSILCGYADGAIVAYALHFGIADGCKSLVGLDKQARERERAALAQATKRDLLRSKRREDLIPAFFRSNGSAEGTSLWSRLGKLGMPEAPYITHMQERFALLKQSCVTGEDKFEKMLFALWTAIYSHEPLSKDKLLEEALQFERVGESWSRLGFQRPDPTTDFRAGGMLSLDCLVYFASHYTDQVVRMVKSQVPGSHDHTYPWGPAGINVTCMVARLFWKFDGELVREQQSNWPLFYDNEAFHLLFSEVFVLFDFLWNEMNANYGNFSVVMQATSDRIMEVLEGAQGDINVILTELRSQSVPTESKQRQELLRSTAESLTPINVKIPGDVNVVNEGLTAPDGTSFPPSTPPSKSPRSTWSFTSRLGLGSLSSQHVGSTSPTGTTITPDAATIQSSKKVSIPAAESAKSLVPDANDSFASNKTSGYEEKPLSSSPVQSDDPFACLM